VTTPKDKLTALWQRFRDPGQRFDRAHTESVFALAREMEERIEQLEAPVREAMALAGGHDGVDVHAFARALMKKVEGQRRHIASLQEQLRVSNGHGNATTDADRQVSARTAGQVSASDGDQACPAAPADGPEHLNPVSQVWFRAGLLACREYMASFVAIESPTLAASIRANWWPTLGPDLGPPRQLRWSELTEGEYGEGSFRVKTKEEVSPTLEALPVALTFLQTHCGWPVPHYSIASDDQEPQARGPQS
jgi:hypothetical protein